MSWEADFDVEEVLRRAAGEEASSELNEKFTVRPSFLFSFPFVSPLKAEMY